MVLPQRGSKRQRLFQQPRRAPTHTDTGTISFLIQSAVRWSFPKLIGRDKKIFFFWNQEFQQQLVQYGTKLVTVPTALEREGNFSQSHNTNGTLWTVNDPLNNKTLFPGRIIPASRIDAHRKIDFEPVPPAELYRSESHQSLSIQLLHFVGRSLSQAHRDLAPGLLADATTGSCT